MNRHKGYSVGGKGGLHDLLRPNAPLCTGIDHRIELASDSVKGGWIENQQRRILGTSAEVYFTEFLRFDSIALPDLEGRLPSARHLGSELGITLPGGERPTSRRKQG